MRAWRKCCERRHHSSPRGSRRIPGKNIRDFHGKPIIAYSIEAARKSGLFDHIIVSTDDLKIEGIARTYNAAVIRRPARLADDHTGTQEVMQHALEALDSGDHPIKPDLACCIYPCAPMLDYRDLQLAEIMLRSPELHRPWYVVPVAEWLQDPGQFYFGAAHAFRNGSPLISDRTRMIQIDPRRAIDINVEEDFKRAEAMYAELHGIKNG